MRSRRVVVIAAALMCIAIAIAITLASRQPAPDAPATDITTQRLPVYQPRFNRTQPIIAVVAENTYTELTDYVVPYGVLTESGVAQVFALATRPGPVQMFPALKIQPQATVADFDTRHPQGADYVIVPAVHHTDDPALLAWIRSQATKGATVIGVCDGVWVVANAGLLTGRKAVGHWFSFDDLKRRFPHTEFLRDVRYVADGNVITTTGVTASIPVSLALVEAIAGQALATALARSLGVRRWDAGHRSTDFKLDAHHAWTAAGNHGVASLNQESCCFRHLTVKVLCPHSPCRSKNRHRWADFGKLVESFHKLRHDPKHPPRIFHFQIFDFTVLLIIFLDHFHHLYFRDLSLNSFYVINSK
jgi:putative intracellular protease/amidase